jgi:hypothetical protein
MKEWLHVLHRGCLFLDVSHPRGLKGACSGMGARTVCVCVRERERERIDDGASRRDFVSWLEWVGVWLRL